MSTSRSSDAPPPASHQRLATAYDAFNQRGLIDPLVEPRGFAAADAGRIVVDVHQAPRSRAA